MSGVRAVFGSLATYKAIESQRLSFTESHDAIIRRALAERSVRRMSTAQRVAQISHGAPRRGGRTSVRLFGQVQADVQPERRLSGYINGIGAAQGRAACS